MSGEVLVSEWGFRVAGCRWGPMSVTVGTVAGVLGTHTLAQVLGHMEHSEGDNKLFTVAASVSG